MEAQMQDTHASQLVTELKQIARSLSHIEESLKKLVGQDGLRVELGIHDKLDKLVKR
jgi:hypothetical protein